jgi:hypothetical protein
MESRRIRCAEHVACLGERRDACSVLVGTLWGKRPLKRSRRKWDENIKMDINEIGWKGVDWIDSVQDMER